jgi:hypothetical protein
MDTTTEEETLLQEGLEYLRTFETIQDTLSGINVSSAKHLCEDVVNKFRSFFTNLKDDSKLLSKTVKEFPAFTISLRTNVDFLRELREFIIPFAAEASTAAYSKSLFTDEGYRSSKARKIATFYAHFHKAISNLMPEETIDAEARKRESFELHVAMMLGDLLKQVMNNAGLSQELMKDLKQDNQNKHLDLKETLKGISEQIQGLSIGQKADLDSTMNKLVQEFQQNFSKLQQVLNENNNNKAKEDEMTLRQRR